jgi:hypothetical protein
VFIPGQVDLQRHGPAERVGVIHAKRHHQQLVTALQERRGPFPFRCRDSTLNIVIKAAATPKNPATTRLAMFPLMFGTSPSP